VAQEPWPTVTQGDVAYWQVPMLVPKESDPDSSVYIYVAKPVGGIGNPGPLVKGDPGQPPTFDTPTMHPLAHDDTTAASIGFTEVAPPSETEGPVYHADVYLHEGKPGKDGTTSIDLETIDGTAAEGKLVAVNDTEDGFDFVAPKVGGVHWPASVHAAPDGTTGGYTLARIRVAAGRYESDWFALVSACCEVVGSGDDVQVDLVARLGADDGPVIGRCYGMPGRRDRLILIPGPDAGASESTVRVPAGTGTTVFVRVEQQSGADTYATIKATTRAFMSAVVVA
jgi:hypothetical protein